MLKLLLDFYGTINSIHNTGGLCLDIVTWKIYNSAIMLLDYIGDQNTVGCNITDSGFLVISHKTTISNDICTENSGELTLKTFICHRHPRK